MRRLAGRAHFAGGEVPIARHSWPTVSFPAVLAQVLISCAPETGTKSAGSLFALRRPSGGAERGI